MSRHDKDTPLLLLYKISKKRNSGVSKLSFASYFCLPPTPRISKLPLLTPLETWFISQSGMLPGSRIVNLSDLQTKPL